MTSQLPHYVATAQGVEIAIGFGFVCGVICGVSFALSLFGRRNRLNFDGSAE